jgi:hypothetical protein
MTKNRTGKARVRNARTAHSPRKVKGKAPPAADNPRSRFAKLRDRATLKMTADEILTLTRDT